MPAQLCPSHLERHRPNQDRFPPLPLLSMSAYMTNVLLTPIRSDALIIVGQRPPAWLYPLSVLGLGQPLLFILAQISLL